MRSLASAVLALLIWGGATASVRAQSQSTYQLFQRGTAASVFDARQAESIWQDMIRQLPNNSAGHYYLGLALADQSRFAEAEAAYRRSIQLNQRNAIAHYHLSTVLSARQNTAPPLRAYAPLSISTSMTQPPTVTYQTPCKNSTSSMRQWKLRLLP